jgi:Reverse transcriptase (RNA-dependent DNA polymerase)
LRKDIGRDNMGNGPPSPESIKNMEMVEQCLLQQGHDAEASKEVPPSQLSFLPPWLIDKAVNAEKAIYSKAVEEVKYSSIPPGSNIISSHCFLKIKFDTGRFRLKCRMVPHGNRDAEKESIRADSSTAQSTIIRVVSTLFTILQFSIARIDVSAAYLQAGPMPRSICVCPPRGWCTPATVWRLTKPAYGTVESGRLWQVACEEWMREQSLLENSGPPQVFALRDNSCQVVLKVAKVLDDLLVGGKPDRIHSFYTSMAARFELNVLEMGPKIQFAGFKIFQREDFSIELDTSGYLQACQAIEFDISRRKRPEALCTASERASYRALCGKISYLGATVLPTAAFCASYLQQNIGVLCVKHLVEANYILRELHSSTPKLAYLAPGKQILSFSVLAFSDAAHLGSYGQGGYLAGLRIELHSGKVIWHLVDWHSSKLQRVAFSSTGAEILAAATAADRRLALKENYREFARNPSSILYEITVDRKGLVNTMSTLHDGKDYRLRPTVCRLHDSFASEEIRILRWTPGLQNLADALKKRNYDVFRRLNTICLSGFLPEACFRTSTSLTRPCGASTMAAVSSPLVVLASPFHFA